VSHQSNLVDRAGNERLIVQFDTEIERFRIHNYRPRVFVILENLADDFVDAECVRAGNLDRTVYRFGDGRLGDRSRDIFECDRRTVSPSMAACAMPRRNSKNWVARTIVYGVGAFLMRLSCASLARK
jgi:hypothetical protein